MEPNELVVLVGLPRSGKTTLAREWADRFGAAIVSPDSIRLALHGQRFQELAEPYVWAIAQTMVRALFLAGNQLVILDATNTTRKRRDVWRQRGQNWSTFFLPVTVDPEECIRRARAQEDEEIIPVIRRMAAELEPLGLDEPIWPTRNYGTS